MWSHFHERFFVFLALIAIPFMGLGIYTLSTSPILISGYILPATRYHIQRIETIELDHSFSKDFPQFFTLKEETRWWQIHEKVYNLLMKKDVVIVRFKGKYSEEVKAKVGVMSLTETLKRVFPLYGVAIIYIVSAISVFRRHRSIAGVVLAFFFVSAGLYFINCAPMVSRSITLSPFYLRFFTFASYISAGGLIALAYFALVFPRKKKILERLPWIPYVFYTYLILKVIIHFSGLVPFGFSIPIVCIWTFIMTSAFIHSLIKEEDPFLKKQIFLGLLAPLLGGGVFIMLYFIPQVIGIDHMNFSSLVLFSLILPFTLSAALDNFHLYQERLKIERASIREKEQICQALHDNIGSDLMNIRFLSEAADQTFATEPEKAKEIIQNIKQTALTNIERLREFLWAVDIEEDTVNDLISYLKSYSTRVLEPLNIDIEFNQLHNSENPHLAPIIRFNLISIYREAVTNIIKHSGAEKVEVEVFVDESGLKMKITDNGCGFDPKVNLTGHYGLKNMKKRAEEMGGMLNILSTKGKGTEICLILSRKYLR
jgi:signal transduction histidine kinase